jgi:hypothetical protein
MPVPRAINGEPAWIVHPVQETIRPSVGIETLVRLMQGRPGNLRPMQETDAEEAGGGSPPHHLEARYSASTATPVRFADELLSCQSRPMKVSPGTSVTPRTCRGTPNSSRIGRSSQP